MPLLFSCIAAMPVAVLGCRTRGLLAFAIALLSGCAAILFEILSLKNKVHNKRLSVWQLISAFCLRAG